MKEFWDKRYGSQDYVYGTEPNEFFKQTLLGMQLKGRILFPGEGEGRNAVFAAKMGLDVTAFDLSREGKKKAIQLAASNQVQINYLTGEFSELSFEENSFDVITLIFVHFSAQHRTAYHQRLLKLLKKNGILIVEGFSKNQLKFVEKTSQGGGPKDINVLYSEEEIKSDFKELEPIILHEEIITLKEGSFHEGKSSVIRYVGRKIN